MKFKRTASTQVKFEEYTLKKIIEASQTANEFKRYSDCFKQMP